MTDCPNDGLSDCDFCENERGGSVRCCTGPLSSIECGCHGQPIWIDCEHCPECEVQNHCEGCADVGECVEATIGVLCKECNTDNPQSAIELASIANEEIKRNLEMIIC